LINAATSETIPLENFAQIHSHFFEKYIISLNQSNLELNQFIQQNFYFFDFIIYGLKRNRTINLLYPFFTTIKKIKPNLIHAHHTKAIFLGTINRLILQIPFFITTHNDFSHFNYYQKLIWFFASHVCDIIICNSENTKNSLPNSINSNKIHVIYNGVDFKKITQLAHNYHNNNCFFVGTVCRMVPQKDLETLLRGFHTFLLNSKNKHCYLVLIGDGPERQKMVYLANELSIQDNVIFKGELRREDVYRELGQLDVFVVSSIYEGFCNAMVEAAGAGLCVVATNIAPLPEVIGKDNARFFPVGDSHALGNILTELEADPIERERLGKAAQEHVISRYSLEASAAKHAELYKDFIQSRKI
jgi:glycosyltransferase involved in cell wall biosynthesis